MARFSEVNSHLMEEEPQSVPTRNADCKKDRKIKEEDVAGPSRVIKVQLDDDDDYALFNSDRMIRS